MSKIIKFEKENCTPCKMVDSFLNSKNVNVEKIDVLEDEEMVEKYNISSVPVTILLDDKDIEIGRSIGFKPPELEGLISKL